MTVRGKARHDLIQWQRQQMEAWSEATWCAGWIAGCADMLWYGGGTTGEMIRETAEMTGVWWVSDREYIPLDEWKRQQEEGE